MTSVNVERVFSQGRIILSHLRSRLSVQSSRALLCLGEWSLFGYVQDIDLRSVVSSSEIPVDEEEDDLPRDWDAIVNLD